MQVKRVWFVSHYSMPPEYEMRIKTQMFAHFFGLQGIDCTIFSASTIHNTNINLIRGKEEYIERQYGDLRFIHIRCSSYTKTDLKRIINMEQFAYRFKKVAENYALPDVIIADTYCISYKPIYQFCKKHGIPFVVDVRDLWPQSIIEYLHFSEKNPLIQLMYNMERNMYLAADRIIFSFDGGYDYIRDRNLDKSIPKEKVFFINNGVDLDAFIHNSREYRIQDEDLNNPDFFKVVYVGSIRKVNNLGILLDAAKEVKDKSIRYSQLEIVIVDDSPSSFEERSDVYNAIMKMKDKRIDYLFNAENIGACASRNKAIENSTGEYIIYVDDDDELVNDCIEKKVKRIEETGVGLVYSDSYVIDEKNNTKRRTNQPKYKGMVFDELILRNFIYAFPMVRRECFEKCGMFDIKMQAAQDYEMWLRIAKQYEVDYVDEPLAIVHLHSGERISKNPQKKVQGLERISLLYKDYLDNHPKAEYIRSMTLIPFYIQMGKKKMAFSIFMKEVRRFPFKIITNLKYFTLMLRNN